jgi:hypothetical protein
MDYRKHQRDRIASEEASERALLLFFLLTATQGYRTKLLGK